MCKLNRSLYGLKQASRAWNQKFHGFLTKFGFIRSSADSCVYVKSEESSLTLIAIWVDDGLICSSDMNKLDSVVQYLSQNFEMTCGPVDCFVGIRITRDRFKKTIHLSQENYIARLLEKFSLSDCFAPFQGSWSRFGRRRREARPNVSRGCRLPHLRCYLHETGHRFCCEPGLSVLL